MTLFNTIQYSNSDYQRPKISASTKRRLESLGIDPTLITSETQALSLIERRNSEKSFEEYAIQNSTEPELVKPADTADDLSNSTNNLYSAMNYQANNTRFLLGI